MTTLHLTEHGTGLATAAATAAAAILPAAEPVLPAEPVPGDADSVAGFAGAVVADVDGLATSGRARVALLVGPELVGALAGSPLGGLDLASAVQPTMDAIAAALGGRCGAGREVELSLVVADLGGPFTVVPLVASQPAALLLIPDAVLGEDLSGPADSFPGRSGDTAPSLPAERGIELLHGVDMEVTVELGRTRMTVRDLLALSPGAVLELDRAAGSPADLLVNGRLIARGEVVVVDEDFGLRVTEIVTDTSGS
ncbi:flagellar motor switch protein FliN [Nocardioides ferulae]|uniref:flagellar motor switch protein FliN n=1 Tax=Nocardioides ferulae TaxID=2340821 RepID=UPI000EAB781C|nr:flagellar motor switch protein FliN [Nocardioides ferulae]